MAEHTQTFLFFFVFDFLFIFGSERKKQNKSKSSFFFAAAAAQKKTRSQRNGLDAISCDSRVDFVGQIEKKLFLFFFHREKLIKMIPQADLWVRLFIARKDVANTAASRRRLFFLFVSFFFWVSLLLSSHVLFFVSFLQRAH